MKPDDICVNVAHRAQPCDADLSTADVQEELLHVEELQHADINQDSLMVGRVERDAAVGRKTL